MLSQPWWFAAVQGPIPVFDLRRRCPKYRCRWPEKPLTDDKS